MMDYRFKDVKHKNDPSDTVEGFLLAKNKKMA